MSKQPGIAPWIRFTEFDPSHHEFVVAGLKREAHLPAAEARKRVFEQMAGHPRLYHPPAQKRRGWPGMDERSRCFERLCPAMAMPRGQRRGRRYR
jgi:hypothetical protein